MEATVPAFVTLFRADARSCFDKYLSRIVRCLQLLSEKEIWWRPNEASNAAGNIVLHLCGNVYQWIVSGLGGSPDVRERDKEFAERGPIPRRLLIARLKKTVEEASKTIDGLSAEAFTSEFVIQGYNVSGLAAVARVYEHFSYHTGQIIYLTKLKRGKDLRFTRLPPVKAVAGNKESFVGALKKGSQIKISVTGRNSRQTITLPVWFVLEDDTLWLLPVHGSKTQWYQNLLRNPTITVRIGREQRTLRAVMLRSATAVRKVIHSFGDKYTPQIIKRLYPGPLNVVVKVETN